MKEDLDIKANPIKREAIEKVLSFLPYFLEENDFGKWQRKDTEKNEKGEITMSMPYMEYSEKVRGFLHTLRETDFIVIFEWHKWDRGREILKNLDLIKKCDILELRMLLTAIVRNERFCTGAFLNAIKDGTITSILMRLKEIFDNND